MKRREVFIAFLPSIVVLALVVGCVACLGYRLAAAPTKACAGAQPVIVRDDDTLTYKHPDVTCSCEADVGRLLEMGGEAVAICLVDHTARAYRWEPLYPDGGP